MVLKAIFDLSFTNVCDNFFLLMKWQSLIFFFFVVKHFSIKPSSN